MSIYADLVCHDCQISFFLGKVLRTEEDIIFALTEGGDPNQEARYLESNRVVWKMLATHMRHWMDIVVEGYNERSECYLRIWDEGDGPSGTGIDTYLQDFDDSPDRVPIHDLDYNIPPYHPGFLVCYDCKHRFYLGKAIRNPLPQGGIQFFYKDNPKKIPNSKNSLLSQGLWKMMVDHAKHHIGVIVGEQGTEKWVKIGEEKTEFLYVFLESYVGDWNWGKKQEAIEAAKYEQYRQK